MVDSSIGGKLGLDFDGAKNMVGVFQNPLAVAICPEFLVTLPRRELRAGFAEICKHALVASKNDWNVLKHKTLDDAFDWPFWIEKSLKIKQKVVENDPFEHGERKILNFGHTIGHALESYFLNSKNPILHGEAVAAGMVCETFLSINHGKISAKRLDEISIFLIKIFGKIELKTTEFPKILEKMRLDKKNKNGEIRFALLEKIGRPIWNISVSDADILRSLRFYQSLK
jgi:3-dehydroquinate synthase